MRIKVVTNTWLSIGTVLKCKKTKISSVNDLIAKVSRTAEKKYIFPVALSAIVICSLFIVAPIAWCVEVLF